MKTFNFSKMETVQPTSNEVEQLLGNLNKLIRKHAVGICVRHVGVADSLAGATRPSSPTTNHHQALDQRAHVTA